MCVRVCVSAPFSLLFSFSSVLLHTSLPLLSCPRLSLRHRRMYNRLIDYSPSSPETRPTHLCNHCRSVSQGINYPVVSVISILSCFAVIYRFTKYFLKTSFNRTRIPFLYYLSCYINFPTTIKRQTLHDCSL